MGTRGLPMIPGHEPLGIIEEIAPATAARWGVSAGDRVAVEILIPCRSCDLCLAGRLHAVQEQGRQPRRLQPARARPRPVGRLRRVHAPAPELDRAPDARRHPGRDRGDVQPARRGRALGAAVRRRAPGLVGAGARRRAARPGGHPRLQVRRRGADHRHRAGPGREEARAGAGVRRRPHDQRRRGGHRRAGQRADRRRRRRRGARPDPDGAAADPRRDRRGPLGRHRSCWPG